MRPTTASCSACSASARNLAASAFARSASASALAIWAATLASCCSVVMFLLPQHGAHPRRGELQRLLALVRARVPPEALHENLALVVSEELRDGLAERSPAPHVNVHVAFRRFVLGAARLPRLPLGGVHRKRHDVTVAGPLPELDLAWGVLDGEEPDEMVEVSGDEGHP